MFTTLSLFLKRKIRSGPYCEIELLVASLMILFVIYANENSYTDNQKKPSWWSVVEPPLRTIMLKKGNTSTLLFNVDE